MRPPFGMCAVLVRRTLVGAVQWVWSKPARHLLTLVTAWCRDLLPLLFELPPPWVFFFFFFFSYDFHSKFPPPCFAFSTFCFLTSVPSPSSWLSFRSFPRYSPPHPPPGGNNQG